MQRGVNPLKGCLCKRFLQHSTYANFLRAVMQDVMTSDKLWCCPEAIFECGVAVIDAWRLVAKNDRVKCNEGFDVQLG